MLTLTIGFVLGILATLFVAWLAVGIYAGIEAPHAPDEPTQRLLRDDGSTLEWGEDAALLDEVRALLGGE